jgi:signal transduction histidine kinase
MDSQVSPEIPRDSLEWLSTEKLLELIAHDINNLCHAAISYLDLALDPSQPAEMRTKFLGMSKSLAHRASRFTPHVRVLSDLRTAEVARTASDPLRRACEEGRTRALALNPGAALDLQLTGDAWERRVAGGKFVTVALGDLLDNAIRFVKPGQAPKAVVDATLEGASVVLKVRDHGKGYSKGQEAYAAQRFSQVGSVSGAGIGLALVRILSERTGGSVSLATADGGKGAIVTLRLPLVSSP